MKSKFVKTGDVRTATINGHTVVITKICAAVYTLCIDGVKLDSMEVADVAHFHFYGETRKWAEILCNKPLDNSTAKR